MAKKKNTKLDPGAISTDDEAAKFLAEAEAPKAAPKRGPGKKRARRSDLQPVGGDVAQENLQAASLEKKRKAQAVDATTAEATAADAAFAKNRMQMPPLRKGQTAKYYYVRGVKKDGKNLNAHHEVLRVIGPDEDEKKLFAEIKAFEKKYGIEPGEQNVFLKTMDTDPFGAGATGTNNVKEMADIYRQQVTSEYKAFKKAWMEANPELDFYEAAKEGIEGLPNEMTPPAETNFYAATRATKRAERKASRTDKPKKALGARRDDGVADLDGASAKQKLIARRQNRGLLQLGGIAKQTQAGNMIAVDPKDQAALDALFKTTDKTLSPAEKIAHRERVLQKIGLTLADIKQLTGPQRSALSKLRQSLKAGDIAAVSRHIGGVPESGTVLSNINLAGRKKAPTTGFVNTGWIDPPELTSTAGWAKASPEAKRLLRVTHLFETGAFDLEVGKPAESLMSLPSSQEAGHVQLWEHIKGNPKALAHLEAVGTNAALAAETSNAEKFIQLALRPTHIALNKGRAGWVQEAGGKDMIQGSKLSLRGGGGGVPDFQDLAGKAKGVMKNGRLDPKQFNSQKTIQDIGKKSLVQLRVGKDARRAVLEAKGVTFEKVAKRIAAHEKTVATLEAQVGMKVAGAPDKLRKAKAALNLARKDSEILAERVIGDTIVNKESLTAKSTTRSPEENLAALEERKVLIEKGLDPTRTFKNKKTGEVERAKLFGKRKEAALAKNAADIAKVKSQIPKPEAALAATVAETKPIPIAAETGPIPIAGEPELSKLATKSIPMGQEAEQRLMAEGATAARDGTKVVRPAMLSGAAGKMGFMGHAGKWLGPLFAIYGVYETLQMLQDGTIGDADRERLKTLEALGSVGGGVQEDLEQRRTIQNASRMTDLAAIEGQRNKDKMNSQFLDDQALNAMLHGQQASLASIARPSQPSIAEMMSRM